MAKKRGKSAQSASALDVLLAKTGQSTHASITLSSQYDSVLSVARSNLTGLMSSNPGLHISEARELLQRARAQAVVTARQFREQRLTASVKQANRPPTGIKGLVDGPTYTDMFNPDWANHCPPDAIEATTSPVAYLADLYRYAKELEATGDQEQVIGIDARRPDLKDLVLDHTALNQVVPTLTLVNEILEKSIRTHLDGLEQTEKTVDDALLDARYPNVLPFERYTSQINYVLGRHDYSLGDAIRFSDPSYPYFKEPGVHSDLSDVALAQDTGLGPAQQALLLEPAYFSQLQDRASTLIGGKWRLDPRSRMLVQADEGLSNERFYRDNFGVQGMDELLDTQAFCLRTGLNTDELDALLSVGPYAVARSPHVVEAGITERPADARDYGSAYINGDEAALAPMAIETLPERYMESDGDQVLIEGPHHRITNATPARIDRMNRMIRLARWLDLPFHEVDQILMACMRAEKQSSSLTITSDTLRALGLFQNLRRHYKATAEDFAVLMQGIGVYSRGKTPSHFDRIFNIGAPYGQPLILDGAEMNLADSKEASRTRVSHLCTALGMTDETFRYLARTIERAKLGEKLTWSLDTVSAFYRLTRGPRYMGLGSIEALALLQLLDNGGTQLLAPLAGIPRVYTSSKATADTLSVVEAMARCAVWVQQTGWTVETLVRLVLPPLAKPVATDTEINLLQQLHGRLFSALVTDSRFSELGLATGPSEIDHGMRRTAAGVDWIDALSDFIDPGSEVEPYCRGLIRYLSADDSNFEALLSDKVAQVLASSGESSDYQPKIVNMVMRHRAAQEALMLEGLAGYCDVSTEATSVLLAWVGGNRYSLLAEVARVGANLSVLARDGLIHQQILDLLGDLKKHAALARQVDLSPAVLSLFLEHPEWFGMPGVELSWPAVYLFTQYAAALLLGEQPEQQLLDYIRLINELWDVSDETNRRLIRDNAAERLAGLLEWGVREVLLVGRYLDRDNGVIRNMRDMSVLIRMSQVARQTGLDATAMLALQQLTPTSPVEECRYAAQLALSTLSTSGRSNAEAEMGQSHTSIITASTDRMVAKSDDQVIYTVTLLDFTGEPYPYVDVTWSWLQGEAFESRTEKTDVSGKATWSQPAGDSLGLAQVAVSYGMGRRILSPIVEIGCDPDSVECESANREPDEAAANRMGRVNYQIVLKDRFGNEGADQVLEWITSHGEFVRYQTITDRTGTGTAVLRSLTSGSAMVAVRHGEKVLHEFEPVQFNASYLFDYVRFLDDKLYEGVETKVACLVVQSDQRLPAGGVTVDWSSPDNECFTTKSKTADDTGIAVITFTPLGVRNVQVSASVTNPGEDARRVEGITARVNVRLRLQFDDLAFTPETLVEGDQATVECTLTFSDGGPAANEVIQWSSSVANLALPSARTDEQGIAKVQFKMPAVDSIAVTASASFMPGVNVTHTTGPQAVIQLFTFEPLTISGEMIEGKETTVSTRLLRSDKQTPVANMKVDWLSNEVELTPVSMRSDEQGWVSATFTPGSVEAYLVYIIARAALTADRVIDRQATFNVVLLAQFECVEINDDLKEGQTATASCTLLRSNGDPAKGQTIRWTSAPSGVVSQTSSTNDMGVATVEFTPKMQEAMTVIASATGPDGESFSQESVSKPISLSMQIGEVQVAGSLLVEGVEATVRCTTVRSDGRTVVPDAHIDAVLANNMNLGPLITNAQGVGELKFKPVKGVLVVTAKATSNGQPVEKKSTSLVVRERPRLERLEFKDELEVGKQGELRCWVKYGNSSTPVSELQVRFTSEPAGVISGTSKTDNDGMAVIEFSHNRSGDIIAIADATFNGSAVATLKVRGHVDSAVEFSTLGFEGPLFVGVAARVMCQLKVRKTGEPVSDQLVTFSSIPEHIVSGDVSTDENGIASQGFIPIISGAVTASVSANVDGDEIPIRSVSSAVARPSEAEWVEIYIAGELHVNSQVLFSAKLVEKSSGRPVMGVPLLLSVFAGSFKPEIIPGVTGVNGICVVPYVFKKSGTFHFLVTAMIGPEPVLGEISKDVS